MHDFFLVLGVIFLLYHLFLVLQYTARCSIVSFWFLLGAYCLLLSITENALLLFSLPLILFFSLLFLFFVFWICAKSEKPDKVDLVLVLGTRSDGTQPTSLLSARADLAAEILKENPKAKCLLSGGKVFGEAESEARALKALLLARGIEEKRLLLEEESRTTKENFLFSFPLFPEGIRSAVVISSSYHLFRASLTARSSDPPCPLFFLGAQNSISFLPHLFIREFFTFSTDFICGRIQIKKNSEVSK